MKPRTYKEVKRLLPRLDRMQDLGIEFYYYTLPHKFRKPIDERIADFALFGYEAELSEKDPRVIKVYL